MSTTQAQSFDLGLSIKTVGETSTFDADADELLEWQNIPVEVRFDREHDNLLDVADVTDSQRARLLEDYIDAISNVCPEPLLMPLGSEGKESAIVGTCGLESDKARSMLHTPSEAIDAIESGHTGFCLYAGKEDHNTENIVFADHDDMSAFPESTLPDTLTVRSGSGRGIHETFLNDGTVQNGDGKDEYDGSGEIRAENRYCVVAGSIHEDGGIYHVIDDTDVATLSNTDIPNGLQQSQSNTTDVDVDVDLCVNWDVGETNAKGYTLDECRARDDELDALLSTAIRPNKDAKEHDDNVFDAQLVSKLCYHHFSSQQIASIWKQYRGRAKLSRTDYVRTTMQKYGNHNDRWDYRDTIEHANTAYQGPNYFGEAPDTDVGDLTGLMWNYGGIEREDVWDKRDMELENGF